MVDGMVGYMPNVRTVKLMPRRASDESIGYLGAKLVNSYAEQLDSLTSTVDIFATRLMPTLNLTNLQTLVLNKLYAECFWNHFVDDINQQNYSDILCFHRMQTLDLTFGPPGISLPTPNNTNMLHCDKTLFPVLQYLGIASCPDYLSAGIFHHAEFSTNLHTITVIDSIPLLALIRPGIDISTIKTLQIVVNKPVDPELFFQTMDLYLNDNCTYDLCKLCIYKVGFDIAPGLAHWAALTWLYIDCVHFVTLVELMQRMQRLKTVDARVVAFDRPDSPGLADEFDPFDYPRLLPETPLCPDLETLRLDRFGPTIPLIAIVACVKSLVDRLPVLKAFVTADHGVSSFINPKQEMHT
ncbi:hypothetical protein GGF39_000673 [Coemansia sp. RSA 1721]|nr:hypothetical protein GGF39_000673 [Coemansia sp. RSA 1721]